VASKQREELAARTALLYYEYQKGQNEIALELGISRSYVSQLLTFARESGIVKINISVGAEYLKETEFASRFPGLRHAYIMQSQSEDYTQANIGRFAAPHVSRLINGAEFIGVNLGRAVQSVIESLDESDFPAPSTKTVAQIMGGFNNGKHNTIMPGELVTMIAKKTGAKSLYLNCPAIIENPSLKMEFMQENSIASVISFWSKIDLAIMGVGVTDERSRVFTMMSSKMRKSLEKSKACCELTVNFFDEQGNYKPVLLDNKCSIPYEELSAVKTKVVIGHGAFKARAILAGLRAEMINILITDSITVSEIESILAGNRK